MHRRRQPILHWLRVPETCASATSLTGHCHLCYSFITVVENPLLRLTTGKPLRFQLPLDSQPLFSSVTSPSTERGESEEGLELIEFLMSPLPPSLLFDQEDELEEEQSLESELESSSSFQPQSAISWEGRERRLLWILMSTLLYLRVCSDCMNL